MSLVKLFGHVTVCVLTEHGNWPVSTTSSLSFFHHRSWYIAGLLLTTLLLLVTLLNSANVWKVFVVPCHHGSAALKEYAMPFTAHKLPLPTPEKFWGNWFPHIPVTCLIGVPSSEIWDRLIHGGYVPLFANSRTPCLTANVVILAFNDIAICEYCFMLCFYDY
jgi:hypothetical protein